MPILWTRYHALITVRIALSISFLGTFKSGVLVFSSSNISTGTKQQTCVSVQRYLVLLLPPNESWAVDTSFDNSSPVCEWTLGNRYHSVVFIFIMVVLTDKNIPKRSPHRCSKTLLSLVRTPHSLQPLLSPSLDALSRAWNSERTFLTCIWSSSLASSLSVAQATQSLGREKPSIHHTALWWACLDVKRGHSLSSGWALAIFSH